MRSAFEAVDRYWFGHGSPVSLGVLRILVGLCILASLLITGSSFDQWYTEQGFVPQAVAQRHYPDIDATFKLLGQEYKLPFDVPRINLLRNVTETSWTLAFYWLVIAAAVLTTVGYWTRLSSIVLAIGLVTIHHRNGLILHSGDTLLRISALYLAISPCGKACSLDRFIGLWKGRIPHGTPQISLWPQRLITFNLALVYVTSVWHKWQGASWRDGTATWYPARLNEFKRFPVPEFVNELPFVRFATYGTVAVEFALGTLVFWRPARKWVLLAGLLMHGYIEYSMNVPMFSFAICSLFVAFYDGEEVTAWAKRIGERLQRFRLKVDLPVGTRLEVGSQAALAAADPMSLVSYSISESPNWRAATLSGSPRNPFRASLRRSPGAWLVGLVPGLWRRMLRHALEPAPVIKPYKAFPTETWSKK